MADAPPFKYWAFISYSHRDRAWGDWLHRELETYRFPKSLAGKTTERGDVVPTRLFPVFRDREELPTSASLSDQITNALERSRHLVVICSPNAARSLWVDQEILAFKQLGRADRILAIVVEGEPNASDRPGGKAEECFPRALRFTLARDGTLSDERTEPIAADARPQGDGRDNAKLKLIAGLAGVAYDDLKQRDQERRLRRLRATVALVSGLLALFIALGVALYLQRNYAQEQERLVRETLGQSDFLLATERIESGDTDLALAYLARAIRTNEHPAATRRAGTLLQQRAWAQPTAPAIRDAAEPFTYALFNPDGTRIVTVKRNAGIDVWDAATSAHVAGGMRMRADIQDIVISPDGQRIAAGCGVYLTDVGYAQVWDLATGTPVGGELTHEGWINRLVFSPDGTLLATSSGDGTARIWSIASGLPAAAPLNHEGQVVDELAFSPDGAQLATIALDNRLRLWRVADGSLINSPVQFEDAGTLRGVDFHAGGDVLMIAADRELRFWHVPSRAALQGTIDTGRYVWSARFLPGTSKILVAGSSTLQEDGHVVLYDARDGSGTTLVETSDAVIGAQASRDAARIVVRTTDGITHFVAANGSGAQFETLHLGRGGARSAELHAEGSALVTTGYDGSVQAWELAPRRIAPQSFGGESFAKSAVFTPDGGSLITANLDGHVRVHDVTTGELRFAPLSHPDRLHFTRVSPDGRVVAAGGGDELAGTGFFRLWDLATGEPLGAVQSLQATAVSGQFSGDGTTCVIVAGHDGEQTSFVQVWDVPAARERASFASPSHVWSLAVSPDGARFAIGAGQPTDGDERSEHLIELRRTANGERVAILSGHNKAITSLAFSPDGTRLFSTSWDGTARIWRIRDGRELSRIETEQTAIAFGAWSADGARVALAVDDDYAGVGYARVFDAFSGAPITGRLPERGVTPTRSVSFTHDGQTLLATQRYGGCRLWDATTGRPLSDDYLGEYGGADFITRVDAAGTRFVAPHAEGARVWDLPPPGAPPEWLPDLLEAVGGVRLGANGLPEPVENPFDRLATITTQIRAGAADDEADAWVKLGRWFLEQ